MLKFGSSNLSSLGIRRKMKMNRNKALLMACALGLGLSAESMAGVITVNGDLSDWGLNWSDSDKGNDWTPNAGIFYAVEDYTGGPNRGGRVDPGYGGQAYDAEALYVTWDANNLYIALVTGHNPMTLDNGYDFGPGDFALAFWNGAGAPAYIYGIETTGNFGSKGDVYAVSEWSKSPYWGGNHITSIKSGVRIGAASLVVSTNPLTHIGTSTYATDQHWVYEVSVDKSIFGDAFTQYTNLDISWTMNCANDIITVQDDIPTIDEPPGWALLGLSLPAVFWRRRFAKHGPQFHA